jgi:hypothetical protein
MLKSSANERSNSRNARPEASRCASSSDVLLKREAKNAGASKKKAWWPTVTNSAWLRAYPDPAPTTLILIGFSQRFADTNFTGWRVVAHNENSLGVKNEESDGHPDIFLCGPLRCALGAILAGAPAIWVVGMAAHTFVFS